MEGRTSFADCRRHLMMARRRGRSAEWAMSLEQLNSWLNTLEPAPKVDGTSMLDGYLTAIVIGPPR
jgi:uncharacterized protein